MADLLNFINRVAITGGAGFIGSNLLHYLIPKYPDYLFVNIDALTYSGNAANLKLYESSDNYRFEKIDITDFKRLEDCFKKYNFNGIIHLAAETHVDRSILGPARFVETNINGTFNLLELARGMGTDFRFYHISTDEVFGSASKGKSFKESDSFNPSSPYAASKASADCMVRSYHKTYGLNTVISNCSNNFGPFQFPEKLIPLIIKNALNNEQIPVYGDGKNVRDWLYVIDHCRAIDLVYHAGENGQTYNIAAGNEITNIDLINKICEILSELKPGIDYAKLIVFVDDRPGHDLRYALNADKIKGEIGWKPDVKFEDALKSTIMWYLENEQWIENCISGDYKNYYDNNYLPKMRDNNE